MILAFAAGARTGARASLWSPTNVLLLFVPSESGGGHHLQEPLAAGWVCSSYPVGLGLQSCVCSPALPGFGRSVHTQSGGGQWALRAVCLL